MSITTVSLQSILHKLPDDAQEAIVNSNFASELLEALGFRTNEIYPEYQTGNGAVDKAARKNIGDDVFLFTKSNPYLLVELKGRDINLSEDSAQYKTTVKQLKRYLLASNCKTVQWGIITNSSHIQLFRKHGKVIYPATQCLSINADNIDDVVTSIRNKIATPNKALTVAVYNNKGGVGKTTTTINLAAMLTVLKKKVLVIDFDPNQQDLTNYLGLQATEDDVFKALTERSLELQSTLYPYKFKNRNLELRFDVIPADEKLVLEPENKLSQILHYDTLYRKLELARQEYDYILIDSSPNWRLFSQLSLYASDVILIPTKHNNLFSLKNAATAITKFIPDVQKMKKNGSPIPLPIFFNGEKITPPQLAVAQKEINNVINTTRKKGFDLLPYFYPRYTKAKKDLHIPQVPNYAHIASSAFSHIPAVYTNINAREYYKNLVKEYFLQ